MSLEIERDDVFSNIMIATIKLKTDTYQYLDEVREKEEQQSANLNDAIDAICDWIKAELQNTPDEASTYKPVIIDEKKMKLIAEWYGYEPQSRQCIEEMAELTQAINKLWRKKTFGGNGIEIAQAHENVIEEIADVSIMICQMKELLGVKEDDISEIINQKLDRQLERINTLGKQPSEIQEDKIINLQRWKEMTDEQWKEEGRCSLCRRKGYCKNPCKVHKDAQKNYLHKTVLDMIFSPRKLSGKE
nr:MAG TPA: nucleoside triphosphate pyrophosphohydrolase [Caudoviricetes sp.]